jgi:hypothetical protein
MKTIVPIVGTAVAAGVWLALVLLVLGWFGIRVP